MLTVFVSVSALCIYALVAISFDKENGWEDKGTLGKPAS